MRCNWFTKASCISHTFATTSAVLRQSALKSSFFFPRSRPAYISPKFSYFRVPPIQKYASSLALDTHPPLPPTPETPTPTIPSNSTDTPPDSVIELTSAQMSREAWKATRLALHQNDIATALIIGEAVRLSHKPPHSPPSRRLLSAALEFSAPVPQRLSSHALLHGLLRLGHIRKAHNIANILMANGVRIHGKTFERVIEELVKLDADTPGFGGEFFVHLKELLPKRDVLRLQPSTSPYHGTSTAIRLLQAARNYKQYRSERMFQSVIHSCLLHGELIAATLLFAAIVKDCAIKEALLRKAHHPTFTDKPDVESQVLGFIQHLRTTSDFFPSTPLFQKVVTSISTTLSMDPPPDPQDKPYKLTIRAALQALANLAVLLDYRQLPYNNISAFIRVLYNVPKVDYRVWIIDENGWPASVKAYTYFHDVLKRLIEVPPRYRRDHHKINLGPTLPGWSPRYSLSFPMDLRSCNALLHYSLRHRLSPRLANRILRYMDRSKTAPVKLEADVVTYNILLSSGRLLRSPSIAEDALENFRAKEGTGEGQGGDLPFDKDKEIELPTVHSQSIVRKPTPNFDDSDGAGNSRFSKALRELAAESVDVPSSSSSITPDRHTLSAYITYLVSTGRPHLVADLLFEILPELSIVDHPAWGTLPLSDRKKLRQESRQTCIKRVARYGPWFFVAVLNAVVKAGRTGLAERVWHLAKEAERASWVFGMGSRGGGGGGGGRGLSPWCLPVHAYTLMLVCYGNEARKPSSVGQVSWEPRSKRYATGWAGYVLRLSQARSQSELLSSGAASGSGSGSGAGSGVGVIQRPTAGRESAILLYNSLFSGARIVYNALQDMQKQEEEEITPPQWIQLPKPDARFFNAMLRIVTHHPSMRSRRARTSLSHWQQHVGSARFMYARYGQLPPYTMAYTREVADDMTNAGFPLPIGLRYLLIGRDSARVRERRKRHRPRPLRRGPWAFPVDQRQTNGPFALWTEKEKGLPIGLTRRRKLRRQGNGLVVLRMEEQKGLVPLPLRRMSRVDVGIRRRRKIRLDKCKSSNGNG